MSPLDWAVQVRQLAMEMIVNCRTSDEVKTLLRNPDGCMFRGRFPYPRLITAMDHRQKEFVAHTNVQQVLETAWIGDWIEWKSYSPLRQWSYPAWRLVALPVTVALGVLAPDSSWNRSNQLPINRMYNGLVTYLAFLALLFVQSNTDKYRTSRGAPRTVVWALVAVFVLGHVVEKIRLRTLQGPGRYFGNAWNVFDTAKLALFAAAYVCWFVAAAQIRWVDGELNRKYWHWADPQLLAEGLFAVATVMAYLRLLFLCQLNYYVGPMQVSLGKALQRDFGKFATFLVVIMAAFTGGLGTLYGYYAGMMRTDPGTGQTTKQEHSFVTVGDTFKTLFWGMFCMTTLDAPNVVIENAGGGDNASLDVQEHHFTQLVGYGLFAAFEVLMVIVMLNMLIAAMSDTFQRVADNAEYEWLFGRTEVYVDYMLMDDLPPPFNLLPTARLLTRRRFADTPRYDDLHDHDPAESRALTAELIKRYFTHKNQIDRFA